MRVIAGCGIVEQARALTRHIFFGQRQDRFTSAAKGHGTGRVKGEDFETKLLIIGR